MSPKRMLSYIFIQYLFLTFQSTIIEAVYFRGFSINLTIENQAKFASCVVAMSEESIYQQYMTNRNLVTTKIVPQKGKRQRGYRF